MPFAELPAWRRNLVVLFLAQTLSVVGFALVFPFLPLYVAELGVRTRGSVELWSGLAYSSQAISMLLLAPVWGALADRFGRKMMIQRAQFGGALVLGAMAFARSAEELVLLRMIQGMITGVIPASSALVAATAPRERAGWALGWMQASVWVGTAVGPLVGGLLADTLGFHAAFLVTGALLVVSGMAVYRWASDDGAERSDDSLGEFDWRTFAAQMRRAWGRALESPGVRSVFAVKFGVRFASTMVLPVAPLLVARLSPSQTAVATTAGLFTAVSSTAGILAAARFGALGDRIGHRTVLVWGCVASGLAYLPFAAVQEIWHMLALGVVIGIANGAVMPGIGALLAHTAPQGGQGIVYGMDASVNAAARAVAPLAGAGIAAAVGLRAGFVGAGIAYLLAGFFAWWALNRTLPRSPPEPSG
jgi:MFS transporter, DHA1 family, multidrug resistance protein